jgi:hypothetical protein
MGALLVVAAGCPRWQESFASQQIKVEWDRHANVIEAVLAGKEDVTGDYLVACIFFERLTGISIRGEMNYDGWMPNKHSKEDFERVKEWYVKNHGKLCWNSNTKSVVLCGPRVVVR